MNNLHIKEILKDLDSSNFINEYKKICRSKGYRFFKGPWNINLFGVRLKDKDNRGFNDLIGVIYEDNNKASHLHLFRATTKPSPTYLKNPINELGTGIIKAEQYPSVWQFEQNWGKFKYPILRQVGKFNVYRDNNRDTEIDYKDNTLEVNSNGGFQLHSTGCLDYPNKVGYHSAGCQVIQNQMEHEFLMSLLFQSIQVTGYRTFTYTLIELS